MLNFYAHKGNCNVRNTITLEDWLDQIQYSDKFTQKIIEARENKSISVLKESKELPCVTFNFLFDRYKMNRNITTGTGYLYIDVDIPGFDIKKVDETKVHAYYKSLRLKGYAIIVRVEGLTLDNFESTYIAICRDLKLELDFDKCAAKASQFSILSHDEEMYYNPSSFVYTAKSNCTPLRGNTNTGKTYTMDGGTPQYLGLRFDNTNEINIGASEDYVVDWENGYEIMKAWLPKHKLNDGRYKTLLAYASTLVALNIDKIDTEEKLAKILHNANPMIGVEQLSVKRVRSVVKTVMKYRTEGTLKGIMYKKKRKIVYNKKSKMTKEEKMETNIRLIAEHNTECSIKKIDNIITNWNSAEHGLISIRNMAKYYPISKKTVAKYYNQFKSRIEEYNNNLVSLNKKSKPAKKMETKTVTSIKEDMKANVDAFVEKGDFSIESEIKLMVSVKNDVAALNQLDDTINQEKQYKAVMSYYDRLKLKSIVA